MVPRLFVETKLKTGAELVLSAHHVHYLKDVLRKTPGASLIFFDGQNGEFTAEVTTLSKKEGTVTIREKVREQGFTSDLVLAFAPVKRQAVETIIQKATELGVSGFQPVITARTNSDRLRLDRLSGIAKEAAEQCGRLTVPEVRASEKLRAFIDHFPKDRALIFCDEAGDDPTQEWGGPQGRAMPMLAALQRLPDLKTSGPGTTILIGPEGGFAPDERTLLRSIDRVNPVTLGPRILRADTAAIAAITLWQAVCGDLRKSSD